MSAKIGSLNVDLTLDTARFSKRLKETQSKLGALGAQFQKIGGLMAGVLAGGAVVGGLAKMTLNFTHLSDELSKTAQSIGIGTEELSRLRYAAGISGVEFEALTKSVGRLARNMNDAAEGLAEPRRAFEQLGISVKKSDGTLRTTSEVIGDVAERFATMEDGAQKAALAQELFGRAGLAMIPFLNQGKEGIKQLTDEAERFGVVIDEETGRRAEAFNDNLTRLGGVSKAVGSKIAAQLLPQLLAFSEWLVANADDLAYSAKKVGEWGAFLVQEVRYTLNEFKYLWDYAGYLDSRLPWWLGGTGKKLQAPVNQNVIDSLMATAKRATALGNSLMGLGNASEAVSPRLRDALEGMGLAAEGAGQRASGALKGISAGARDAQREASNLAGLFDRLFPADKALRDFRNDVADLEKALAQGKISLEKFTEARAALGREFGNREPMSNPAFTPPDLSSVGPLGVEGLERGAADYERALESLGKKSGEVTVRVAQSLKDMANEGIAALQRLSDAIRGGGFLDILSSVVSLGLQLGSVGLFGKKFASSINQSVPGRAAGGPISAGRAYLVGERGPELVVPRYNGHVVPNHALGGGTTRVEIVDTTGLFVTRVNGQIMRAAPGIATGAAQGTQRLMQRQQTRRLA